MQAFAINKALNYIEGNQDENLPKLMDMVDKFSPDGCYEGQRAAIRKVIEEKTTGISLFFGCMNWIPNSARRSSRTSCSMPA